MRLGQAQSQSVMGVKRPRRLRARRRSRLRRVRSLLLPSRRDAQGAAWGSSAVWWRGDDVVEVRGGVPQTWAVICSARVVIGGLLGCPRRPEQRVVGAEGPERDAEVAHAGIGGQHDVDQGQLAAHVAVLLEHVGEGGGTDRAARVSLDQGGIQGGRSDLIEQGGASAWSRW